MRAPVSRSRPLSRRCSSLLVLDHPLVGHLCLHGQCTFGVQNRAVGAPDPRGRLRARRSAGGQLKLPQLLLGQRGSLVGVVLAAGEHAPEQHRELAGGRDDRFAVTTPTAGAFIKCAQRTGLLDHAPR
jgi:hypothetical protein